MANVTGADFVRAEKSETADDAVGAGDAGDGGFVAEAVLECEDEAGRREQIWQQVVLRGLEGDEGHVAGREVGGAPVGVDHR